MIGRLLSSLQRRTRIKLGLKPKGSISTEELIKENVLTEKEFEFKVQIKKLKKPHHINEVLHESYDRVTDDLLQEHCSHFSLLRIGHSKFLNYNHLGVILHENKVIKEYSFDPANRNPHPVLTIDKYPEKSQQLKGKTLVLHTPGAQNNYFHFLLDLCQKIGFVQKAGFELNDFDHIITTPLTTNYQKEIFELLDFPLNKIRLSIPDSQYQMEEAIVPSHSPHNYFGFEFLRNKLLSFNQQTVPESTNRKYYISREKSNGRRVINEQEVLSFLEPLGFEKIFLEELSVLQQINIFSNAEFIICPHGASMANIIFANPKLKYIEIHDKKAPLNTDFFPYSIYTNIDFGYLMAESIPNPDSNHFNFQNIRVDLVNLEALMTKMEC